MTSRFAPAPRRLLVDAGVISDVELNTAMRSGRIIAPFRGVIAHPDLAGDLDARFRAALATQHEDAMLSHTSAAVKQSLRWLPSSWSEPTSTICVYVRRDDAHRQRDGLRRYEGLIEGPDCDIVDGIRVCAVARTLADLARDPRHSRLLVVSIVDGALRDEKVSRRELDAALARMSGLRHVCRAREFLALATEKVDSPMETQLRLILHDGGIVTLTPGYEICEGDGTVLTKGDLVDEDLMLWGEYDGRDTHGHGEQFSTDRRGDRWLERRGWHVMRFSNTDLDRPAQLQREWRTAAANAPARIMAMNPRRSPELARAQQHLALGVSRRRSSLRSAPR